MQHVDEGDLHAWLDGALDQLGEGRAAQVREHLRTCAACREALVAEETMRARADQVLALAVPRSIDAPPFETLVERARALQPAVAAAPRSRLSRVTRMGWAASVVIALGAGWMARTLELGPEPAVPVASAPVSEVVQIAAPPAELGDAVVSDAAGAAAPLSAQMAGAGSAGPTRAVQPGRQDVATAPVVASGSVQSLQRRAAETAAAPEKAVVAAQVASAEERSAPPAAPALAPAPTLETVTSAAAGIASVGVRDAARERPAVTPPTSAPEVGVEQKVAAPVANRAERAPTTGPTVIVSRRPRAGESVASSVAPRSSGLGIQGGRDTTSVPGLFARGGLGSAGASKVEVTTDADIDEAVDLIVPDLPVLRVEWTEVSPGRPGLRVLQRLAPGDTLEVRFVRSGGAAADALADPLAAVVGVPLRAGWSQVVRVHRDGWLVARAPLKVEELEELVNRAGRRSR